MPFLRSSLSCLFGLLCVGAPPALAQAKANLEANVVPSLVFTYNTALQEKLLRSGAMESSTRFESFSVGARDILVELIYTNRIPGPLTGWKLVARADSTNAIVLGYRLYAVKTGQPEYALDSESVDALNIVPSFAISKFKEVFHGGRHYTGSGTFSYYASGYFAFADYNLYVAGNTTAPYTFKVLTVGEAKEKVSVGVPGTIESKVGGGMFVDEETGASILVSGSLKFSSHRILSLVAE